MGTHRRNRTGDKYGIFRVTGLDPDDPNLWGGIWGCCGRYQAMTVDRCGALSRQLPKRCIRCVRQKDSEDEAYSEGRQARERERMRAKRAAAKLAKNHPEERHDHEGVIVPGWGYVPALRGDFGRLNANGHETQGWRRKYEWARDDETACAA
jgi:hypothetical protein